jgi:hypothetical protein
MTANAAGPLQFSWAQTPPAVPRLRSGQLSLSWPGMKSSRRGGSFGGFLFGLVIAALIAAGVWYFVLKPESAAPAAQVEVGPDDDPPAPTDENTIARKMREWKLTPEDLKRELASAGKIVREKGRALGDKVATATSDVTIITKIKAKYALDNRLQALKISVGCKDGQVALSGSVAAPDLIGRAVVLAIDTDGVVDVVSSLTVEPKG